MIDPRAEDFQEQLFSCTNYKQFLRLALRLQYSARGKANVADFSRKAGFGSKSYLSEVLAGKKSFSESSLRKVTAMLSLPRECKTFFKYLVYLGQPKLKPKQLSDKNLRKNLEDFRNSRNRKQAFFPGDKNDSRHFGSRSDLFQVYAALGRLDEGSTVVEILRRTKLSSERIRIALDHLIESGAVSQSSDRFYALSTQVDLLRLKGEDGLSDLVEEVSRDITRRRKRIIDDPSSMAFYTAFSVKRSKILQLRRELEEAVFDVLDRHQDDGGEAIEQLAVFMYKNQD